MQSWIVMLAAVVLLAVTSAMQWQNRQELKRTLREQEQLNLVLKGRYSTLQQGILQEMENNQNAQQDLQKALRELQESDQAADQEAASCLGTSIPASIRDRLCSSGNCR